MNKIYVNGKEFGDVKYPDNYLEEPKRNELVYDKLSKGFFTHKISLPKDSAETLKKFFLNYKDYEAFMRIMLTEDEFDCWQFQAERIYKMFKGENENV